MKLFKIRVASNKNSKTFCKKYFFPFLIKGQSKIFIYFYKILYICFETTKGIEKNLFLCSTIHLIKVDICGERNKIDVHSHSLPKQNSSIFTEDNRHTLCQQSYAST